MKTIIDVIDLINEKIAKLVSYLAIVLVLQLVYEVFCRYILDKPNIWSFDVTYFISSFFIIFGMAYTWKMGGHVGVDLFSGKMPPRIKAAIFCIFMLALFFTSWGNIVREMLKNAIMSWSIHERSTAGSMPPVYPYKTWMLAGVVMLMVQGLSQFLKSLHVLITGKTLETGDGKYEC